MGRVSPIAESHPLVDEVFRLRTMSGMSFGMLATRTGLAKSTLTGYASGAYGPSVDNLDRILRVFGKRLAIVDEPTVD